MDPTEIVKNKVLWKICEAVHLNLETVYLNCFTDARRDELMATELDGVPAFSGAPCKASRKDGVYRFTLSPEIERHVRYSVLPSMPDKWWIKSQPWMSCSNGSRA